MTNAAILATLALALGPFGATLLLSRRPSAGPADLGTALLRLAQALPLPVTFLYDAGAWWAGIAAILLGVVAGLGAASVAGGAALPLGVVALAAGLSYVASIILASGRP